MTREQPQEEACAVMWLSKAKVCNYVRRKIARSKGKLSAKDTP
jgi:hypothetical protein